LHGLLLLGQARLHPLPARPAAAAGPAAVARQIQLPDHQRALLQLLHRHLQLQQV
jgi:hypothetical protein